MQSFAIKPIKAIQINEMVIRKLNLLNQVILFALLTGPLIALCEYCSKVDRNAILNKFESCRELITNPGNSTVIQEHLYSILDDIESTKLNKEQHVNADVDVFMHMVQFVQILHNQDDFKTCFDHMWCSLFKNCEFPIHFQYDDFNRRISKEASRLASILTAFTTNEKRDNQVYLTRDNIEAQLRLAVIDSHHSIIKAKVILRQIPEKNQVFTAYYAITDHNQMNVVSFEQKNFEKENTNKLEWYHKWDSNQIQPFTKQIEQPNKNESVYLSSDKFDSIKYVSGITFDCDTSMWIKIVSVPFAYPDKTIR